MIHLPSTTIILKAVLLCLASLRIIPSVLRRWRIKQALADVKGPPHESFVWGHERKLRVGDVQQTEGEWLEEHGLVFRYDGAFGSGPKLIIADPAAVNYLLIKEPYSTVRPSNLQVQHALFVGSKNLAALDGEEHRKMRRILNPSFSAQATEASLPVMYETLTELRAEWDALTFDGPVLMDARRWASSVTFDIIIGAAFGVKLSTVSGKPCAILDAIQESTRISSLYKYYSLFVLERVPYLFSLPVWVLAPLLQIKNSMTTLARPLLGEARRHADHVAAHKHELLSRIVTADGAKDLSDDVIMDQMCVIFFAGHETTAASVAGGLYHLAQNPSVQHRLRAEVRSLGQQPSYAALDKLRYLSAVVAETLRIESAAPGIIRAAAFDLTLPLAVPLVGLSGKEHKSLFVPVGTSISISSTGANVSTTLWGPDSMHFRPERWLERYEGYSGERLQGWSNILTFSAGPRICLGYRFAVAELMTVIATLVASYTFELPPNRPEITRTFIPSLLTKVKGREAEGAQLPLVVGRYSDSE